MRGMLVGNCDGRLGLLILRELLLVVDIIAHSEFGSGID